MPTRQSRSLHSAAALLLLVGLSTPLTPITALGDDGKPEAAAAKQPAKPAAPAPAAPAKPAAKADAAAADAQKQPANMELLNDFVHYTLIDRADLAKSMGQGLIDRNIPGGEFMKLVDQSQGGYKRFTQAVQQAQKRSDLEPVAAKLLTAYETGRLSVARSPESIALSIKQLTGLQRERLYASEHLVKGAGEYAMPQLLAALFDTSNTQQQAAVRQVIVDLGKQAIIPLGTALPNLKPAEQELVLRTLGDIPYPTSAPFIYDILRKPANDQVRVAAEDAAKRVSGGVNKDYSLADRFVDLANEYYKASPSLISFPTEANQPYWTYLPGASGAGLDFQAIDTRVFPASMAMRLSEEALKRDPANQRAVSTWLAANFTRELRSPAGYVNPAYAKDRRDAMYYAVAAGSGPVQDVLARALDNNDAPLARKALAALERMAGGKSLYGATGSAARRPLSEALRFPNRRVQYDAALAVGAAGPRDAFPGSDQVVRILGSAIRDAGAKFVAVIAGDTERQASLSDMFRAQGYTPLPPATRLEDLAQAIADAPGVDLIVTDLPAPSTQDIIERAHSDSKLRATPMLALLSSQGASDLSARYSRDALVRLARQGLTGKEVATAAQQLLDSATGGDIKAEDAVSYKTRSLFVLRDLGVSANGVMNIADAQGALVSALADPKAAADVRLRTADVLVFIPTGVAQNALMDAAMAATNDDRVKLLTRLTDSAKRNGNLLDTSNVNKLLDLAQTGKGEEATAAAALIGALNLPNAKLVPLILGKSG